MFRAREERFDRGLPASGIDEREREQQQLRAPTTTCSIAANFTGASYLKTQSRRYQRADRGLAQDTQREP